ncbi:MAG: HD domain-containing protein [Candidatus Hydrogenedentes bacterium]|nr:HD domain-containing protein [Candidatus Hydrogenedentota bacterium]
MKKQFVATLQEGDTVNDYFVAARKDLRDQANGNKFLGMVFKDRTGEVGGIMWNNAVAVSRLFELGDVVNVRGSVATYQDRLQIRVDQVLPLRESEYDLADLIYTPADIPAVLKKFRELLVTINTPPLRKLVDSFLNDADFMRRFSTAAAGKKWHHSYRGGLAQHCYEVARIALTMCDLYPQLDRNLLLTAVFLHDVGKLDEMTHDMMIEYTTPGKLLGHLAIGVEMIQRRIDSIEDFPEKLRLELLHCVLSHHGELVNGSPVVPKTLEAIVLYHCDNLDAQASAIARVVEETKQKDQPWSEYLNLIERQIWTKQDRGL